MLRPPAVSAEFWPQMRRRSWNGELFSSTWELPAYLFDFSTIGAISFCGPEALLREGPRRIFLVPIPVKPIVPDAPGCYPRTAESARTDSCCICNMELSNWVHGPNACARAKGGFP